MNNIHDISLMGMIGNQDNKFLKFQKDYSDKVSKTMIDFVTWMGKQLTEAEIEYFMTFNSGLDDMARFIFHTSLRDRSYRSCLIGLDWKSDSNTVNMTIFKEDGSRYTYENGFPDDVEAFDEETLVKMSKLIEYIAKFVTKQIT